MSSNEMIIMGVVFGTLLFGIIMLRVALHYLDKAKRFAERIEKLQVQVTDLEREIEEKEIKFLKESKQTIDECDADLKELRQKIDAYDEAFKRKNDLIDELTAEIAHRDAEIEKLKDELQQRDASVKEKSHKNKNKSK